MQIRISFICVREVKYYLLVKEFIHLTSYSTFIAMFLCFKNNALLRFHIQRRVPRLRINLF